MNVKEYNKYKIIKKAYNDCIRASRRKSPYVFLECVQLLSNIHNDDEFKKDIWYLSETVHIAIVPGRKQQTLKTYNMYGRLYTTMIFLDEKPKIPEKIKNKNKLYYCEKCRTNHRINTKVGKEHNKDIDKSFFY